MKLSQLMQTFAAGNSLPDTQVTSVTCDSRQVEKGSVFVCIQGETGDGHTHIAEARERGAVLILTERDCDVPNQIITPDTRAAYATLCATFFGYPAHQMKLIGVTGTNGKTSTAWILQQTLEALGKKTGLIGTICNRISGDAPGEPPLILPAHYTTPDPWGLQSLLRRMADQGCEYVVMETSSHALVQKRVEGCQFLCGVFTNLTPEHLDFHKTMEAYYQAKKSLFLSCRFAAINLDDQYGRRLAEEHTSYQPVTFSVGNDSADFTARQVEIQAGGSRFVVVGKGELARISIPMPGEFSVSNALGACAALTACGVSLADAAEAMSRCTGVPGRIEVLSDRDFTVIRDYAHTPDALEKVLTAIRRFSTERVITLFGCPGRRDTNNRAAMAEAAAKQSDFVVMTADNPREEPLTQIFEHARPGLEGQKTPYKILEDRKEAILWALGWCKKGDVLLLAGKGHEDYQVLADRTIFFDEQQIVTEYFNGK